MSSSNILFLLQNTKAMVVILLSCFKQHKNLLWLDLMLLLTILLLIILFLVLVLKMLSWLIDVINQCNLVGNQQKILINGVLCLQQKNYRSKSWLTHLWTMLLRKLTLWRQATLGSMVWLLILSIMFMFNQCVAMSKQVSGVTS